MLIYSYKFGSKGARKLRWALKARRIKHDSKTFIPRPHKKVINWGSIDVPEWENKLTLFNSSINVHRVTNKLYFFQTMREEGMEGYLPPFAQHRDTALEWIEEGATVVCRTKLASHSGEGIVLSSTPESLVKAPLYTKYIRKSDEYRVHMVNFGDELQTFSVQRKARELDVDDEDVNWQVRNHKNGFIYMRENVELPKEVENAAASVFMASGLDFGAVDVIHRPKKKEAYVLEINTAPGLEGQTLYDYCKMFRDLVK